MARYHSVAPTTSAVDRRITDHFRVVRAAGMLARHYGILTWTPEQIAWAVQSCEHAHHQSVAVNQARFDPIAAVRTYITDNLTRFRSVPDPSITKEEFEHGASFIYADRYGATEYVFAPAVFDRKFARLNSRRIARAG